ncbi:hypothetical protein CJU35_15130 [Pseudomonas aeruginosa]|nr:hypothetical protein ATC05_25450 [Pseudomonas aeruginosa]KPE48534.1 hypothetical protein AOA76_02795 [Pseudomonas aeruginosa]KSC32985.1 hypothetical protein AO889_05230 [Pseudomonas aeruginosa]KSD06495.1 hypothetical protein AO890_07065 [Pseudomonas aeruginosa]ONN15197.1 hypothetical protein B0B18_19700 [Pseudomonas aeruginosa]
MAFATEGRTPGEIVARLLSHADASGGIGRESLDTEKRLFRVQAWDDRSTRVALIDTRFTGRNTGGPLPGLLQCPAAHL